MSRRGRRRSIAVVLFGLGAVVSCGSRTGLFVPEDSDITSDASFDASFDVSPPFDVQPPPPIDAHLPPPDASDEPPGCVPGTFGLTPATSEIVFVLDRSRSMLYRLDENVEADPGETSRWTALRDALTSTLTPFSSQIAMGARFFPSIDATGDAPGACQQDVSGRDIAPVLNNASTILQVFRDTTPIGGTPTAQALQLAAQISGQRRSVARAMVVATDGAPNCNPALDPNSCVCTAVQSPGFSCAAGVSDDDGSNCLDDTNTVSAITDIFQTRKIPVFVVGIGVTGSFATTLDAMAVAGGRPRASEPRYYPADTPAALTDAFTVVRDSVAKCSYVTPSAPKDPNAISVDIAGIPVPRDPTHTEGWDWIDQEFGQLQLFGSACTNATTVNVDAAVTCGSDF